MWVVLSRHSNTAQPLNRKQKEAPKGASFEEIRMTTKRKTKAKQVKCRVLFDSYLGKINEIITLDVATAQKAEEQGFVDCHPNAIKAAQESA